MTAPPDRNPGRRTLLAGLALAGAGWPLAGGLGGCAPQRQPVGPAVGAPRLTAHAIIASDGYRLPLRVTRPEGPPQAVVLALHGFGDRAHAFWRPARAWAEAGIITYAYDQRGFGATRRPGIWAGGPTLRHDLRTAIDLLRAEHTDLPLTVLGESMGGAVAITALADPYRAPAVDNVVLVSPAVWPRQALPPLAAPLLDLMRNLAPGFELGGQGLGIRPTDNDAVLRDLAEDPLVQPYARVDTLEGVVALMTEAYERAPELPGPAIFLFGDNEQVISQAAIDGVVDRLDPARHRFVFYPEGWHMLLRDLNREVVWRDVAAVARDPSAALPSGYAGRPRDGGEAVAGTDGTPAEARQAPDPDAPGAPGAPAPGGPASGGLGTGG